ncbi:tetratricopeptide repeat protein [bacterium]|nr:tetratricopeptide repeat protein [bacterium]
MSIILDALKKAEKERQDQTSPEQPAQAPTPGPKKTSSVLMGIVVMMGLFGAGFLIYNHFLKDRFFTQQVATPVLQPKTIAAPSPDEEAAKLKDEALTLFYSEDYKKSERKWQQVVETTPNDADAYNSLGLTQKKMGDANSAYHSYEKALELKPDFPEALNNMAALYLERNQTDKAKDLLDRAIGLKNDYAEAYFHRAVASERLGELAKATTDYKKFLDLTPNIEPGLEGQIKMRLALMEAQKEKK